MMTKLIQQLSLKSIALVICLSFVGLYAHPLSHAFEQSDHQHSQHDNHGDCSSSEQKDQSHGHSHSQEQDCFLCSILATNDFLINQWVGLTTQLKPSHTIFPYQFDLPYQTDFYFYALRAPPRVLPL